MVLPISSEIQLCDFKAVLQMCIKHHLDIRGHPALWSGKQYQPMQKLETVLSWVLVAVEFTGSQLWDPNLLILQFYWFLSISDKFTTAIYQLLCC